LAVSVAPGDQEASEVSAVSGVLVASGVSAVWAVPDVLAASAELAGPVSGPAAAM
jgi:hypothetical protein